MAKKKPAKKSERYEYCLATVDADGNLSWEYKLEGSVAGRMQHDEDVSTWPDSDIIKLTRAMLSMAADEMVEVTHD